MISTSERGFTLVELAIALIVIGLVIGGVLKGQELILNARVNATAAEYKNLYAAHYAFLDRYNVLPGDMDDTRAQARIPNCTAANNCTGPGNNDGRVGENYSPNHFGLNDYTLNDPYETTLYWKHLAMAGFIDGIDISASNGILDFQVGQTHIASQISGALWDIMDFQAGGLGPNMLGSGITDHYFFINANARAFLPWQDWAVPIEMSAALDRKLDDGSALTGAVSSACIEEGPPASARAYPGTGIDYDETASECMCFLAIGLD